MNQSRTINGKGIYYRQLNEAIKDFLKNDITHIELQNINGQRYIGAGLSHSASITIQGTPGNDLAAYMNGLTLQVYGNAQDGVANTMNDGTIVIHGDAGDALGYAMRGGEVFVKGSVGYRIAIHMKEFQEKVPVVVIGGKAGSFFGEYMAGGILILLGLRGREENPIVGDYCGTGMHGGVMYIRGSVEEYKLGKEVKSVPMTEEDYHRLSLYVGRFAEHFNEDKEAILSEPFTKLIPFNKRPYGNLYVGA
ncbi:hypothetical protein [Heliorestis convoluta]|uniref:Glutamate synthase alpha subunit domain protein, putative n=1 Tax=Heliorestis convoluta TaxID=356322 RepID=A0A5Q2N1T7_9FIRM|nr:hypothetical protein [Heliorestis convoluta]QGG46505.1 Glutamate synthase alpha subunit domain protein, putative [Heliorestis convoluta]